MFPRKSMRLMGSSLMIVCMFLSVWAMASLLHARVGSSAFEVPGATTLGTCKEPCSDTGVSSLVECLHLSGSTCETNACILNSYRTLQCVECKNAAPGAANCEYHQDTGQWARWEIWREMPCNSTTRSDLNLGECGLLMLHGSLYHSTYTPCVTGSCYGEIYQGVDQATQWGRPVCD